MRAVAATILAVAVAGCNPKFEIAALSPPPSARTQQTKLPQTYTLAIVGPLDRPLVLQMTSGIGNVLQISIPMGPALKNAVAATVAQNVAHLSIADRKDEALAARTLSEGVIVVEYRSATGNGSKRQSGLAMVSYTSISILGDVILIPPGDGNRISRQITASGSHTHPSYSPFVVDQDLPAPKAAAEEAIREFADEVVSLIRNSRQSH